MKCYRCKKELPPTGSNCPSCGQAIYTRDSGSKPSMGRRLDGCLREAPSPKDYRATPNLTTLPRKVDLREHCPPVEDQGKIGSCVACAAVGAVEYQDRKAGKTAVDLSRMFVYFNARRMTGHHDGDYGTRMSQGLAAFLAFGAPPEDVWPYDLDLLAKTPDEAVYKQALDHVPAEYARIDGIEHIKGALAQKFPVVFSSSFPTRCYEEARESGRIPVPTQAELDECRTVHGTHAMLVVGYDLNDGTFLVRNSWGEDWGERGYCGMSIDTFVAASVGGTTWILGKLEASGAFTVDRPALKAKPVEGGVRDLAAKMREEIRDSLTKDIKDSFKDIKDRINPRRG